MGLLKEIKSANNALVAAVKELGLELDYSVEGVKLIEGAIEESFKDGEPVKNSFFEEDTIPKLFAVSCYLGEVIIRNTKATKWVVDENDPDSEENIQLLSANGNQMWPVHRMKARIENGDVENLHHYVALAVKKTMKFKGEVPEDFFDKEEKPFWKIW